jgi:hypothetical protein
MHFMAIEFAGISFLLVGLALPATGSAQRTSETTPGFVTGLGEIARIVRLPDHQLLAVFQRTARGQLEIAGCSSADNGRTWSGAARLLSLPPDEMGWGSAESFVDNEGELHQFLLKGRKKAPAGLDIDIWQTRSSANHSRWSDVRCIWKGYTGSLNSVIQLRTGRILLPFSYLTSRTWADRGAGFDAFTYHGTFNCSVLYSDDHGQT